MALITDGSTITSLKTTIVVLPLDQPFEGTPLGQIDSVTCLLAEISTKDGLHAFGHLTWYNPRSAVQIRSVKALIDDFAEAVKGQDGIKRTAIYQSLRRLTLEALHDGIATMAVGVVDIALWDLAAKRAEVSLATLLGGFREEIAVYESSRLSNKDSLTQLVADAEKLVSEGFDTVKVSAGGRSLKEEVARIETIRRALGPEIKLMVDCGRRLTSGEAIRFASAIAEHDIFWLEDPVAQSDIAGLRRVRDHGGIPIATGERISGFGELESILSANAVDYIMFNLQRIGGPTAWLSLAPFPQFRAIPLSAHGSHEFQMHLLASQPNGHYAEYHPWWNALYTNPPKPSGGKLKIRPDAGYGLDLDRKAIARYRAD